MIAKRKAFIWEINPGNLSWLKSALTLMCLLTLSFCLFIRGCAGSLLCMSFSLRRSFRCRAGSGPSGPVVAAHRLWSVGSLGVAQACLPVGVWSPPRWGTEPLSSSVAGGFLTTGPPGRPLMPSSNWCYCDTSFSVHLLLIWVFRFSMGFL